MYWNVRLHPRLCTIEIREMESQADLAAIAGIAALAQAVCSALAAGRKVLKASSADALSWSCFRAARDGLEATIYYQGREVCLRALVEVLINQLMPTARQRKGESALRGLRRTLAIGGGAAFQRRVGEKGGYAALVESLINATRQGSYGGDRHQ